MPENQEKIKDKKDEEELGKLKVQRNMYTSTIGLEPPKPWDPMETEKITSVEI